MNATSRLNRLAPLVVVIAFALPLVVYATLGFYSRFIADDYCAAVKVNDLGIVNAVVNDYTQNVDAIEKLLTELDVSPQQVLVEATILQTTLDESNSFGVDFSLIGEMDFTDLTNPLSPITNSVVSPAHR